MLSRLLGGAKTCRRSIDLNRQAEGTHADMLTFSDQEWDDLSRLALEEGVGPWLYWTIKNQKLKNLLPARARSSLAGAYYQSAAHNQLLIVALRQITTAFHDAGIPIQPLKGAALAGTLYPNPAIRPMSDLDLLIKPADLVDALALLGQLGYHTQKITYHAVLIGGPGGDNPIELHWCLPDGHAVPETWWARANDSDSGASLTVFNCPFGPVEHLLYLSAHLLHQHRDWPRLIWLLDLRLLVERLSDNEKTQALDLARSLGWEKVFVAALKHTGQVFNEPLVELFPDLQDLPAQFKAAGDSSRLRQAWSLLGWRARGRLLTGLFFPTPHYLCWKYNPRPEWLWPVYYPRRWAELARRMNVA